MKISRRIWYFLVFRVPDGVFELVVFLLVVACLALL